MQQVPRQPIEYPASVGNMVSLVAGDLHFIRNLGTGREELYDYVQDPLETRDLSQTAAGRLLLPAFQASAAPLFSTPPRPVTP